MFTPVFILKSLAEFYIRTDGDFKFSLYIYISIIGGIIDIVFDYIFIKILGFGINGAALATVLGVLISLILGIWYFLSAKFTLKFTRILFDFKLLGVAALTIILYAHFLLVSTYLGFTSGISSLLSFARAFVFVLI